MKLLLYGEAASPGTGAWCYAETLREMGHQVITYGDTEGLEIYQRNYLMRAWRKAAGGPLASHRCRHVAGLLQRVGQERPEIVIILKGLHIGPNDVGAMRSLGAWVVNINHDDFFSRNRNNRSHWQLNALSEYDYIFTTREVNVAEVAPTNSRVEFFPFAYYPRIHRLVKIPASEQAIWGVDVVFVGTWERERAQLLEYLVSHVPARYAVWGTQWERVSPRSRLAPFLRKRPVVMDEMAKALGGAKIALAFLRKANRDDYTQRTFEIPACGGALLGERTERHTSLYREREEAAFFDSESPEELAVQVRILLGNSSYREALRGAGREALLRQRHTYRDRLKRLVELYERQQSGDGRSLHENA